MDIMRQSACLVLNPITVLLSDFINLTQVHNSTVSAQDIFYLPSTFGNYRKFHRNFAI